MKININHFIYFIFLIVFLFLSIDLLFKPDFFKNYRGMIAILAAVTFLFFCILRFRIKKNL